jgi:hypothetical protein
LVALKRSYLTLAGKKTACLFRRFGGDFPLARFGRFFLRHQGVCHRSGAADPFVQFEKFAGQFAEA